MLLKTPNLAPSTSPATTRLPGCQLLKIGTNKALQTNWMGDHSPPQQLVAGFLCHTDAVGFAGCEPDGGFFLMQLANGFFPSQLPRLF
jgi:hypothetical protein